MAVRVSWLSDTKQALHVEYIGVWGMDEFYQSYDEFRQRVDSVSYKVDAIIDLTDSQSIPNGLLSAVRGGIQRRPSNTGMVIIVGVNSMVGGMITILRQLPIIDVEMQAVDSFEEALDLIQHQGSSVA